MKWITLGLSWKLILSLSQSQGCEESGRYKGVRNGPFPQRRICDLQGVGTTGPTTVWWILRLLDSCLALFYRDQTAIN